MVFLFSKFQRVLSFIALIFFIFLLYKIFPDILEKFNSLAGFITIFSCAIAFCLIQVLDTLRFAVLNNTPFPRINELASHCKLFMTPAAAGVEIERFSKNMHSGKSFAPILLNRLAGLLSPVLLSCLILGAFYSNITILISSIISCLLVIFCFQVFILSVAITVFRALVIFAFCGELIANPEVWLSILIANLFSFISVFPGGFGVREFFITIFSKDEFFSNSLLAASAVSRIPFLMSFVMWFLLDSFTSRKRNNNGV